MELTIEEEKALEIINAESERSRSRGRTVQRFYVEGVIANRLGRSRESAHSIVENLISIGKVIPISYDYPKGGYIQPVE